MSTSFSFAPTVLRAGLFKHSSTMETQLQKPYIQADYKQSYPLVSPLRFHQKGICMYDTLLNEGVVSQSSLSLSLHCSHPSLLTDRLTGIRLAKILGILVGLYPEAVYAKKHNAYFGLRKDDAYGFKITLNDEESESFLFRVISVFLPNDPTFAGLSMDAINEDGVLSFVLPTLSLCAELEVLKPLVEQGCVLQLNIVLPTTSKAQSIKYLTEKQFPFLEGNHQI